MTSHVLPPITDTGYISNAVSAINGIGNTSCPWVLQVLPGQRINLTLYDFMVADRYKTGSAHRDAERGERYCQVSNVCQNTSMEYRESTHTRYPKKTGN